MSLVIDDLAQFNCEKNFTEEFESPNHLVLRRGADFHFVINRCSLPHGINAKEVTLEISRTTFASYIGGTKFQAVYSESTCRLQYYQWKMKVNLCGITYLSTSTLLVVITTL